MTSGTISHLQAGPSFNITFDPSIPAGELSQVQHSVLFVENEFKADFTNTVTLNIRVAYDVNTGLASSSSTYEDNNYTYTQLRAALIGKTPADAANLPVSNPTSYTAFTTTSANAKALGLPLLGLNTDSDGTVSFGSGPWAFDPSNRAVANEYDFTSAMEHEFSEIMGRQTLLDPLSNNEIGPLDFFRYSASGTRSLSVTTNAGGTAVHAYFSMNNGATNLIAFNDVTGGDIHDWAGDNHDSFDAFGPTDDAQPVTAVDLLTMNAVGWEAVPEPCTLSLWALGGVGLLGRRRRV